jgi:hypothetical protein
MNRTLIGAGVGIACAMALLIGYGAWGGHYHGDEWFAASRNLTRWEAASTGALYMAAYFWWAAVPLGEVIGGLAGLGSWLVRPRATGIPPSARLR